MTTTRIASIRRNALLSLGSAAVAVGLFSPPAHAANFYEGKAVNIIVSYAAGGGYDLYSRMLARHFGDHIPGKPSIVVQNMPGGGGLRAANQVYAVTPKDGTYIAAVSQNIPLFQLLGGEGVQYDVAKFNWIGVIAASNSLVLTWKTSGIASIEDAKKREVTMAGNGIADAGWIFPKAINALAGTKFKVINGYGGTAESNTALERGEVEGMGRDSYSSFKSQKQAWIKGNKITIIAQVGLEKEQGLENVPRLLDLATTEEAKQIATVLSLPAEIGYGHWAAAEVPKERIAILREAYDATMKDAGFLADARKQDLDIRPKRAAAIEALIQRAAATPPSTLKKTAAIIEWK
jgi:tripartite-type tricarboxylate transporter receptor subunit TctC